MTNSGYLENRTRYYNELLESQEMSDVTLACDGYEVGAHKIIISGSSTFFKEVIRKSKHVNPYIYIKGVSKETLETIIKFIYLGEATARTDNLEKLVEAGNELKVFGLTEEPLKTHNSLSNKKHFESSVDMNTESEGSEQNETNLSDIDVAYLVKKEREVEALKCELEEVSESKDQSDSTRLLTEIKKRITTNVDDLGNKNFKCNVCEREFATMGYIRPHIETHLEGFSHKCKFCDVVKRTRKSIQHHQKRYHKSVNNETINAETHDDDNEDGKISTEAEVDMDAVCKEEERTADSKNVKKQIEDNEEGKTNIEIEAVCEEDKTADGKEAKNVVIGEIVDDSNKERFEKELENLMITGEGNNHYKCKVCQKELRNKAKMKLHSEIHLEGFSHKCKYCETVKKTLRSIQLHEWDQHRRNGTDIKN